MTEDDGLLPKLCKDCRFYEPQPLVLFPDAGVCQHPGAHRLDFISPVTGAAISPQSLCSQQREELRKVERGDFADRCGAQGRWWRAAEPSSERHASSTEEGGANDVQQDVRDRHRREMIADDLLRRDMAGRSRMLAEGFVSDQAIEDGVVLESEVAGWVVDPDRMGWKRPGASEESSAGIGGHDASGAWQPIETAPKDGTYVLLWAPGWKRAQTGYYWSSEVIEYGKSIRKIEEWGMSELGMRLPDGKVPQPTLWMPLPALPPKSPENLEAR